MRALTYLFGLTPLVLAARASHAEELPTCEAKIATYVEDTTLPRTAPDLAATDYEPVLNRGTYLTACGVPSSMTVKVCTAVQAGSAVGVSVSTDPADEEIAACVREKVAALDFPSHPKMDVVRTTFAAEKEEPARPLPADVPSPAPPPVESKRAGCGCVVVESAHAPVGAWGLMLLAAALGHRRATAQRIKSR